jgi:hypothetical protein
MKFYGFLMLTFIEHTFKLPVKHNHRSVKALSGDITNLGHKIFDSLTKEDELKIKRQESLKFIQKLSQNYGSENDSHEYIKKCVTSLLDN